MNLFPNIEKAYTKDRMSAPDAQRLAQFIAFGPMVFQTSRLMLKFGILEALRDNSLTLEEIAEKAGLPVASKPDSQEICFVADGNYADYIEACSSVPLPGPGNFVDENGTPLGTHKGIIHYTPGQRKGLGIALGYPAYVIRIDAEKNEVVLGKDSSLYYHDIFCQDLNFQAIPALSAGESLSCTAKIRYHHAAQPAPLTMTGNGEAHLHFDDPVRAPAPGQSAVFYDDENCVIGGGTITRFS